VRTSHARVAITRRGAVIVVAPLRRVGGTGSPVRALALVPV